MPHSLLALRRARQPAAAAPGGRALLAHQLRCAHRALSGHRPRHGTGRSMLLDHAHDLGNHVAGAAHDHRVALAHVQARDLVGVVQGRVGDGDAGHLHRLQPGHRRDRAGAADLHLDRAQHGGLFLGRELVRQRPARRARYETHLALLVVVVELVDHAVDVVGQRVALCADAAEIRQQALEPGCGVDLRRNRETEPAQQGQGLRMGLGQFQPAHLAHGIGEERQRAAARHRRIELPQRSGRAVARVRQQLLVALQRRRVPCLEGLARHVDLAADLEHRRGRRVAGAQLQRHRAHLAQVGGDVLAGGAVAAGGALHEHAVLVAQADRQAVELGFHREHRRGDAELLLDAAFEVGDLGIAHAVVRILGHARGLEGVGQRQHRDGVVDFGKTAVGPDADGARGRVVAGELGMRRFQRLEFAHQRVVVGVRDRRVVEHVVAVVGVFDARAQLGDAGGGGGVRHVLDCRMRRRVWLSRALVRGDLKELTAAGRLPPRMSSRRPPGRSARLAVIDGGARCPEGSHPGRRASSANVPRRPPGGGRLLLDFAAEVRRPR